MRRIFFSPASLAKVSSAAHLDPMREALCALETFATGGGGPVFHSWRRRVAGERDGRALAELARTVRPFPDLYRILENSSAAGSGNEFRPRVLRDLETFHRIAVEPYWGQVSTLLEVDRNARAQIMMSGGVDQLLSTLHPAIRWRPPVLEVPGTGHDIKLESTGLEIAPSLFLFSRSPILVEQQGDRPLLLLYPIPVPRDRENLWDPAPDGDQALGALLGRTRAAVLQVLTTTCTTTEVGELVGISTAAASQHTAVLRAAGLITTLRSLNKVHHTLTPLGGALLRGDPLV